MYSGLSGVPQVCYQNGVAMAESKSYNTVLTMAHEIGHSLGVIHDGSDEAEDCDHEKFIMSPTTGIGKLDWSLCALRQIKSTLVDSTAKCLFEKNGNPIKEWSQQTAGSSLEEQCYFGYGSSFKPHELKPYQKVCSTLFCKSSFFMVAANPAVDGSPCKGIYMEQPTIGKCCKGRCIIQQAQCE
ncbi:adamts-17-like protein [Leptotrombidium deliense]|uniref:Adamts-17-like protein n=1 Tax=Leptotrombidium deliense TaxID=299467 RepID=A0A443RWQ0_9ACAR|nr:adamts-17-like protein [Leptotrombidium deliense]